MRKLIAGIVTFLLLSPLSAFAAIAFVGTGASGSGGSGTASASPTCTGANYMIISVAGSSADTLNTPTVDGSNATIVNSTTASSVKSSLYYFISPASSPTVTATSNGSDISVAVACYSGVAPQAPEASAVNSGSTQDLALTVNTITDNAWVVASAASNQNGAGLSAGANTTVRATVNVHKEATEADGNAAVHPAGSATLTIHSDTGNNMAGVIASLVPGASTANTSIVGLTEAYWIF